VQQVALGVIWCDPPAEHHTARAGDREQVAIPGRPCRVPGQRSVRMVVRDEFLKLGRQGMIVSPPPARARPAPNHRDVGVIDATHAHMNVLTASRHVGPADHLALAARVHEAVADLQLHRQDALLGGRRLALLFQTRLNHSCYLSRRLHLASRVGVSGCRAPGESGVVSPPVSREADMLNDTTLCLLIRSKLHNGRLP
jgi:hypothetical protein